MKVAPEWMLSYFVHADEISVPFAHGIFLLSLVIAALSGHVLTAVQLQRNRTRRAALVLCSGALLWFGLWALSFRVLSPCTRSFSNLPTVSPVRKVNVR